MRKLFLLIPAILLTLAMNADPIPVSPGTKTLYAAINAAPVDAVLELSNGEYNETERLQFTKNITIKAATGAEVTIKPSKDTQITKGAKVTFDGVIIDGSSMGTYNYIFRSYDDSEGKEIHFNNCEVKGCGKDYFFYAVYTGTDKRQMDSCVIDGCNFHDMTAGKIIYINATNTTDIPACKGIAIRNSIFQRCANSAVHVASSSVEGTESCNSVIVKNSTFVGFSALDHSVIDVNNYGNTQASNIEVNVDHCTFYNNTIPSGSYGCIRSSKSTNLTISNCIFAHIDPIDRYATYCYGGTITNCLVHNLTKGHRTEEGFSPANNIVANPYFLNVEYGSYDFTLAPTSPARNAGTGSSNIGDPRWTTDYSGRATTKNITATSNALKNAVDAAWPGDVIILADGEYTQGENYTVFDKNLLIKAADGASPVVKFTVPAQLKQGARAEFKGLKFDMTDLHGQAHYEHLISAEDANDGNKLVFEKCEFYNDAANNSTLYCASDKKLDSLIVNNCKFYDSHKSCIFLENAGLIGLKVTNSTFSNITSEDGSYYAGVIDIRTTTGSLRVDHCTFYNVLAMNTDYAAIGKIKTSDAIVSNCIFAMPTSTGSYRTIRDHVTANNCLVYNYTNESGYGMQGDVTKNNCIKDRCPLFVDAANDDFTLYMASPARRADGSVWGDSNWAEEIDPISLATLPATLAPLDALLSDSAGVVLGTPNIIDFKAIGSHKYNDAEWAKWKIRSTDGYFVFTINGNNLVANTQQYIIKIYEPEDEANPVLNETSKSSSASGAYTYTTSVVQLEDKDYIVKVTSPVSWSQGDIVSIVASYGGGNVVNISSSTNTTLNVADAVYPSGYTRADGQISPNSSWTSAGYAKWNIATDETSFYNITLNFSSENAHNMTVSIYEDENATPVASIGEGGYTTTTGTQTLTDRVYLAGGKNYIVKVTNETDGSKAKITSVAFAPVATPATALPGTLDPSDAILSPLAYVSGDQLYFVPSEQAGHITEQWAQWKVSVSAAQSYLFTMEVSSTNEQSYRITIIDSDDHEIAVYDKRPSSGNQTLTHYFYLTAGTYFVKVQNTYKWSNGHVVSLVVSNPPEGMITIEEDGAPETVNGIISDNLNQAGKTIQLIRTIVGGMYNTICLPFNVDDNLVKEVFGNDVQLRTLASAEIEEGGFVLNLNFNSASDIYPGTPHLIKTSRNIVNPVFAGVEITTTSTSSTTKTNADFIGNFVAGTIEADPTNLFLGAENTLYFPTQEIEILGMRAYFKVHDAPGAPAGMIKRARIVENEQILTDVEIVRSQEPIVNSQKLIENGQLIIVRDGVRYNALGIKLQ